MNNRRLNDDRDQIMHDWYEKGEDAYNNKNDFEAFIYLWIAWVVACKIHLGNNKTYSSFVQKDLDDRKIIIEWCKDYAPEVRECIEENMKHLMALGTRLGSHFKNPIVDASKPLQEKFARLSRYFTGENIYKYDDELTADFAELLNKIRNNLFHGNKSYDNRDDKLLLKAVLSALKGITLLTIESVH